MDILITTSHGQTIVENVEELSITSKHKGLQIQSHEDEFGWGWNVTEFEKEEEK